MSSGKVKADKASSGRKHASSTTKAAKQKHPTTATGRRTHDPPPSFLFVVNEFVLEDSTGATLERDAWMNKLPPMQTEDFNDEAVGTVFRWHGGVVTRAEGYSFFREDTGEPGRIAHDDWYNQDMVDNGEDLPKPTNIGLPTVHGEASVFFCGPFLPCIATRCDASQGLAFAPSRQVADWDDRMRGSGFQEWGLLHFSGDGNGTSFANSAYVGGPCVGGRNASWMPALVPDTFANHMKPGLPESKGLGGELAIVLALMALHGRPGQPTSVFERNYWNNNRWHGPRHSPGADRCEWPES